MTLEKLLNILCEKGWKPRGFELHGLSLLKNEVLLYLPNRASCYKKLRELVSIESGLWQYVCNNKLQKTTDGEYERWLKKASDCWGDSDEYNTKNDGGYGYRVIESSLKDESELEEFLLSNIVIKDE